MPASSRKHSLSELSSHFELDLQGDGKHLVDSVGTLQSAGPEQLTFLANRAYRKYLPSTRAGAVVLSEEDASFCPTNCLVAKDPYLAYARLAARFDQRPAASPGIHRTAIVPDSARIGRDVSIGAHVVIGPECEIGDGCAIGAGTVIEADCRIGAGSRLHANVTLGHAVQLGCRVIVHPGAVIGSDGFGIAFASDHWEKVPQLGSVRIGDDCEIGANCCIDRGAIGDTVLEEDIRLDNLCQIAHNVRIGAHTAMAATAGIAGSATIGKYCLLGGGAGIAGHIEIADRTTINARSQVYHSITEPGTTWSAHLPATAVQDWTRNLARLRKLDQLARKVRALELQLGKLTDHEQ
ncbi:MAG: UDP-3-O-(3-hydroxymyristoyl)glucosamine N-acyltransferase [Xanthomonadales bacterium]|nr:UDP-3-O-(3-hydroxymyristoyl)glucosamine N-acyltransferase [Gammaproteobacteria bacterium]MBT8054581.1 UDP-3-O-(3-hydroxymyristoyl)glucosamine N-acyltransferase [Gammaproteobacteria bacterium]NND55613.1 UDP-3-O-(3-hydroxymyristoyl)glucosamine N-acyltransferase [Xanthomonadales bacterium]NNK50518.1 UDP-3-O-(3-hydroxymyristoyl)glucosamine N-acyltransferase [Xanthomonadales bacterium]